MYLMNQTYTLSTEKLIHLNWTCLVSTRFHLRPIYTGSKIQEHSVYGRTLSSFENSHYNFGPNVRVQEDRCGRVGTGEEQRRRGHTRPRVLLDEGSGTTDVTLSIFAYKRREPTRHLVCYVQRISKEMKKEIRKKVFDIRTPKF